LGTRVSARVRWSRRSSSERRCASGARLTWRSFGSESVRP
jgi:hypothetical protein